TAERGDSIQSITAIVSHNRRLPSSPISDIEQLSGRIISGSGSHDCFTFLHQTLPIWAKSLDSPRVPSPSEGASSTKLLGHCVWPLSIPIPRTVELPSGAGDVRSYRLPETFLERYTKVSVQYDLQIIISRGKLRSDNVYVLASYLDPRETILTFT